MKPRSDNALLLFTSHPAKEARRKKLLPDVDRVKRIYRLLLRHILSNAQIARETVDFDFVVVSDAEDFPNIERVFASLPGTPEFKFVEHQGQGFETQLKHAFEQTQALGYQNIAVVGNDCLDITPTIFANAFLQLDQHEMVLGPAADGGFYLLATSNYTPQIFDHVVWNGDAVFKQVCENAAALGNTLALLPCFQDIDSRNDLHDWIKSANGRLSTLAAAIAAIITSKATYSPQYTLSFIPRRESEALLWQLPPPAFAGQ